MKFLRYFLRFIFSLLLAILLIVIVLMVSGNSYLIKAVQSTYLVGKTGPTIEDYKKFDNRIVEQSKHVPWPKSAHYNLYQLKPEEEALHNNWESVAYLIIQNDSILFEKYWDGYSEASYSNSFSVAKSLVAIAIGAAIKDGCVQSVDQAVGDFLDEFKTAEKSKIRIKDLLRMSSGIAFGESYGDPFGFMAQTYYGDELYDLTMDKEVLYGPSELWEYQGGNTLILNFILKEACGKSLSEFFSEKVWQQIGASHNAMWTINEEGWEKAYCCFYSNARDFARIGKLMLDSGSWNGTEIIGKNYFEELSQPVNIKDKNGKVVDYYGYHWWITEYKGMKVLYARGILGQYIVTIPELDAVMVRLGHKRDPTKGPTVPTDLLDYFALTDKLLSNRVY